jgi:CelD/BcsL family acetyltransferase involved in cellulose biosynthesis
MSTAILTRPAMALPAQGRCTASLVDLNWLTTHSAAWMSLAAEAATDHPFYAPDVVCAHRPHGLGAATRYLVAWQGARMTALMPVTPPARFGWRASARSAWLSPYMVTSTPYLRAEGLRQNLDALLDQLTQSTEASLWAMPSLRLDDQIGEAIRAALAERHWPFVLMDEFERAVLDRRPSYEAYAVALSAQRRKDLARRRRRLAELGGLSLRSAETGPGLAAGVEHFLALEGTGWKGRRGTAMSSRAHTKAFARDLFGCEGRLVRPRVDTLFVGERPIAASLALVHAGTAYLLKSAYDEGVARFAPGVVLEDEIVRALHETRFAARLNSACEAGGLLDSLYPDRERIGTLVFSADAGWNQERLDDAVRQEQTKRRLMRLAKDFYWRLRRAG